MTNWLKKEMTLPNWGINTLILGFGFLGTQIGTGDMIGISIFFLAADYTACKIGLYEGGDNQ